MSVEIVTKHINSLTPTTAEPQIKTTVDQSITAINAMAINDHLQQLSQSIQKRINDLDSTMKKALADNNDAQYVAMGRVRNGLQSIQEALQKRMHDVPPATSDLEQTGAAVGNVVGNVTSSAVVGTGNVLGAANTGLANATSWMGAPGPMNTTARWTAALSPLLLFIPPVRRAVSWAFLNTVGRVFGYGWIWGRNTQPSTTAAAAPAAAGH